MFCNGSLTVGMSDPLPAANGSGGKMRISVVLQLLLFSTGAAVVSAQSPGTFTAAGSLTRPREFHAATLLTNGKALITGGFTTSSATWASAELYDPSTGISTATGDMTTPRYMHTATLLPNGKVFIAGGFSGQDSTALSSAELYDPTTGTFSLTGNMTTARRLHTATLLNNGKVLIAGGQPPVPGAELYDPSTGTFTATGDMTEAGADTATLLPNGKVLMTRCVDSCFDSTKPSHAELYDPATGTFTRTGDMVDPYQGALPTAMLLANGKVLIAGGDLGDFGGSTSAEIYDPATGAFSATAKMTADIDAWKASLLLPDGTVLIAGETGFIVGAAELYDPVTGTFSATSGLQSAEGHAATLLPDGTVLLSGGWVFCGATPIGIAVPGCGGTLASAQIYHPGVLVPAPQLLSLAGGVQGAIQHAGTVRIASATDPAVAGEYLSIYLTGLADGSLIPPQVAIGGRMAEITFFGNVPGYPGLNVINVQMPGGIAPGPAVPVRLTYLSRPSNTVTIGVQ
jgi:hypothetical protein